MRPSLSDVVMLDLPVLVAVAVIPRPLVPQTPPPPVTEMAAGPLLGLGPHADDKVLDVALVDAATDLEGAVLAPLGTPGVGAELEQSVWG